jgi:hypothetical protein
MTLIDRIEASMQDDDEDREKQSEYLRDVYEKGGPNIQAALNEAFISLCGWSLGTPIKRSPCTSRLRT